MPYLSYYYAQNVPLAAGNDDIEPYGDAITQAVINGQSPTQAILAMQRMGLGNKLRQALRYVKSAHYTGSRVKVYRSGRRLNEDDVKGFLFDYMKYRDVRIVKNTIVFSEAYIGTHAKNWLVQYTDWNSSTGIVTDFTNLPKDGYDYLTYDYKVEQNANYTGSLRLFFRTPDGTEIFYNVLVDNLEHTYHYGYVEFYTGDSDVKRHLQYDLAVDVPHLGRRIHEDVQSYENSDFLPFLEVRKDGVTLFQNKDDYTDEERQLARVLKKMGMDVAALTEQLDAHEKIDDIVHAHVNLGVPFHATDEAGLLYLYEFYRRQYTSQQYHKSDFDAFLGLSQDEQYQQCSRIGSVINLSNDELTYSLRHLYLELTTTSGVLDTPISLTFVEKPTHTMTTTADAQGTYYQKTLDRDEVILKRQVSEGRYETLTLVGVESVASFYGEMNVHSVRLRDAFASEKGGPVVPVDFGLLNDVVRRGTNTEEAFFRRHLHLHISGLQRQHVSGWQQFFDFALKGLALIALAVALPNQTAFTNLLMTEGALVAGKALIESLVIAGITHFGAQLAAVYLSEHLTMLVALAMMVYGYGSQLFNQLGWLSTHLPLAHELIALSHAVQKAKLNKVQSDTDALMAQQEAQWDLLQEQRDALDLNRETPPLIFLPESVDEFYTRTTRLDTIDFSLNAISRYVEDRLTLPRPTF